MPRVSLFYRVALSLAAAAALAAQTARHRMIGSVTFGPARPATRVWVLLYDPSNVEKGRAITGDDGRYYIANLAGQTYSVVVRQSLKSRELYRGQVRVPQDTAKDYKIRLPGR